MCDGRVPVRLRARERRRARRDLAVGAPSHRRWTRTATRAASTTSGCAAPWRVERGPARSRTGPAVGDPTLYPSDHLGIAARLRSARADGDRLAAPARASRRLARRARRTRSPRSSAATRVPGCDGVEFDVRLSRDGVPVLLHDETLPRVQRRPGRVDELDAAALAAAGIPTPGRGARRAPARRVLDVELKGDEHGEATAAVLRAARGEAPDRRADLLVRARRPSTRCATLLPGWRRWLNAEDLAPATLSLALGLGCRGVSVLWGGITPARRSGARSGCRARRRGLDGASPGDGGAARPAGRRRVLRRGRGAGRACLAGGRIVRATRRAVVRSHDASIRPLGGWLVARIGLRVRWRRRWARQTWQRATVEPLGEWRVASDARAAGERGRT